MGRPVKVGDDLAEAAKESAATQSRSVAKQIEHWAWLGRAGDELVSTSDVAALKGYLSLSDAADAQKTQDAREALRRLVEALVERTDRKTARQLIRNTGHAVYEAVGRPDRVAEVSPAGEKVVGRFVDGTFVAESRLRKRK